jgi:phage baseplate assembly protein V
MSDLHNLIKMAAQQVLAMQALPRFGIVSSYNPAKHTVKVLLQPDGQESAWMPYMEPFVGNGWGLHAAPTSGNMVLVLFVGNSPDTPVAVGNFYNNVEQPQAVPSGEFWLTHKTGSTFKLTNDGKVTVADKAGSTIILNGDNTATLTASGGLTVNGSMTVNGGITSTGTITAPTINGTTNVNFGGKSGIGHVHSNGNGGANTGAPV